MSFDLNSDYQQIQQKIQATKAYGDLKSQYNSAQKKTGEAFETADSAIKTGLDQASQQIKSYQKQVKSQFDQLLDINNITGGKGSNSIRYVKKLLLKTLKNIEPKIREILLEEVFKAVGCDQNQSYTAQTLYISVKSIDVGQILKQDPQNATGKLLYEKNNQITPQPYPYSMNRQLYNRIQQNDSYNTQYGTNYNGRSGQSLFDIQYVDVNPLTGVGGGWYKIDLKNRATVNNVTEFLVDYYSTIKLFEFNNIMANIMNSLSGAISINVDIGTKQAEDATKFELIVQRILGLCFDNKSEIDVSGVAKIAEYDGVDNSFFEFTDVDLRNINQKVTNIKNGVIEFEECGFVKLPVNADAIIDDLSNLNFVSDDQLVDAADNLTNTLINNPDWRGLALTGNVDVAVNLNFVKLIVQGIISAILSPKILLPIFTMLKALGQTYMDAIKSYMDFVKKFSKMAINLISKIGALFVKELFELVKKDIVNLIQQVVQDVAKEQGDKRVIMILKLIQLLLIIAQFISDWRRCKSVVDEIFQLLTVLTSGFGFGGGIPLPLLYASQLLDGYSESRAFLGTIEELQKLGIPTGPMPDGSPNLEVLSKFAQMKAMAKEDSENNKVQVAVGPLSITPAGLTVPATATGKKM